MWGCKWGGGGVGSHAVASVNIHVGRTKVRFVHIPVTVDRLFELQIVI